MIFQLIKDGARTRFNENTIYLNYLTGIEPNDPTIPASQELKIMKGLFYVHLYGSLEKTANDLIEKTLLSIKSQDIKNKDFNPSFNTISLLGNLQAFKNGGHKNFFANAIKIFEEMQSDRISDLNETAFSNSLQNVGTKTITQILAAFGIEDFIIEPKTKLVINEIVETRNAVAHGRESAAQRGERFRTPDLRMKMETIITFSFSLIDCFEHYHDHKNFIKPQSKIHYIPSS